MNDTKRNGLVCTFYSYKGGVGRSMALANVGAVLAKAGHKVLLVDWDLEAPGVHRYFHPFLDDKELQSTEGLIDMVESLSGRSVAALMSNNHIDPDLAVETFVLAPAPASS